MRESRKYGSVRGALSNERPYRDRQPQSWCDPAGASPAREAYTAIARGVGLPGSKATSQCVGIASEPGRSRVWPLGVA